MLDSPFKALASLRHSQRLLIFGGGVLTTLMILLTFFLETQATLNKHEEAQRQAFIVDYSRLLAELEAREHAFRTAVISASLLSGDPVPDDVPPLTRHRDGRDEAILQQDPSAPAVWLLGACQDSIPDSSLRRYEQLAAHLSRLAKVEGMARQTNFLGYFLSLNEDAVGVLPAPDRETRELFLTCNSALKETLAEELNMPYPQPSATRTDAPVLYWSAPSTSLLTGAHTFRIAASVLHQGKPYAVLAMEYEASDLLDVLADGPAQGLYAVYTKEGKEIAVQEGGSNDMRRLVRDVFPDILERNTDNWLEAYRDGVIALSKPLGDTGWVLIFSRTWRDVIEAVGWQIGLDAAITLTTIVLVWVFLIQLKLRILRPLLMQSRRVFESESLSRTLIGTVPVGLGLIDVESGVALLRSPVMVQLSERLRPDQPDICTVVAQRYKARLAQGAVSWRYGFFSEEIRFETRDGSDVDLSIVVARARYQGKDVLVSAFKDVTAKHRLEMQLREAKVAADQANSAKSAFLAGMTHEIRTPLNAILGNLELLLCDERDPIRRDRLDTVWRASGGLLALVNDVLDFSKIEAGEMHISAQDFDLMEVVTDCLMMFEPVARGKNLSLEAELGEAEYWPVRGDSGRLRQVIQNLLSNAIKFTDSGSVTVRLKQVSNGVQIQVEDTGIGISEAQMQKLFRPFSQVDPSIGRRFGGTGLGLALSRGLLREMGATIEAWSKEGEGSRFTVLLPQSINAPREVPHLGPGAVWLWARQSSESEALDQALRSWGLDVWRVEHSAQLADLKVRQGTVVILWDEIKRQAGDDEKILGTQLPVVDCRRDGPREPVALSGRTVVTKYSRAGLARALRHLLHGEPLSARELPMSLHGRHLKVAVVDDNEANRVLLKEQLFLLGCEVDTFEDGYRAIESVSQTRYDLLVTDLSMPKCSGYELAARLKASGTDLPMIAITANVSQREREKCGALGFLAVLDKPLLLAELEQVLPRVEQCRAAHDGPAEQNAGNDEADCEGGFLGRRPLPGPIRKMFIQSCRESIRAIQTWSAVKNIPELAHEVHTLRGVLGVFRRPDLSTDLAAAATKLRRDGIDALDDLQAFVAQLDAELDTLADD